MDGATMTARAYLPTPDAQKAMTELEAHGGHLADSARRLHLQADQLQSRVDGFMQSPATLGSGNSDKPAPAPQPGTLGCIRYYQAEIDRAAERIGVALNQLAGIL